MIEDWRKTIPTVTRDEMADIDRAAVEDFGIDVLQMMENAGRHLAQLARDLFLAGDAEGKSVAVLAGTGGNGGGALVAARRLYGWGAKVEVALMRPADDYSGSASRQLAIASKLGMRLKVVETEALEEGPDAILDGMIGYGLRGRPKRAVADSIRWASAQPSPVLSLDVPSGMDATTGETSRPTIKATSTLTLALPKRGLASAGAEEFTGQLYLADIGVPPEVYGQVGIQVGPVFSATDLLRLS